jgi:hypothetical protein
MKTQLIMIVLALTLGSLQVQAQDQAQGKREEVAAAQAEDAKLEVELDYYELVMNIFKYHVKALEVLTASESKYSDNVVNHANAIVFTSGLLDHIYPGEEADPHHKWPWKDHKEFVERAQANREAAMELKKVARKWLEKKESRQNLTKALENLKQTCRDCHGEARNWP